MSKHVLLVVALVAALALVSHLLKPEPAADTAHRLAQASAGATTPAPSPTNALFVADVYLKAAQSPAFAAALATLKPGPASGPRANAQDLTVEVEQGCRGSSEAETSAQTVPTQHASPVPFLARLQHVPAADQQKGNSQAWQVAAEAPAKGSPGSKAPPVTDVLPVGPGVALGPFSY